MAVEVVDGGPYTVSPSLVVMLTNNRLVITPAEKT